MPVSLIPLASSEATLHFGEFVPPLLAAGAYLWLYLRRVNTLKLQGRPVESWRVLCFVCAVLTVVAVQLPPLDTLADEILLVHMIQHIVIGEIASLFIVFGLTGPVLAPLLQFRYTRPVRVLSNPLVALLLWAVNLYTWHIPLLYQLAIRHDLIHALEHACLLWFGTLLWLALLGPLPKPAWFEGWGRAGYVAVVRCFGAVLGNVFLWAQTVFYPIYRASDARHGLNPVSDQNLAGGIMDAIQVVLTTVLICWLFLRFAAQDEERQRLVDFAADHGVELSDARAARAAVAGTADRLRDRILREQTDTVEQATDPSDQPAERVDQPAEPIGQPTT
jgi:cytochrome c oxidase assembly factor CtaG